MRNRDTYNKTKRAQLGQNYLTNHDVIRDLINQFNFPTDAHILEIGPGRGAITNALLRTGLSVTAIEKDRANYERLNKYIGEDKRLTLIHEDALAYKMPDNKIFHIFANPPFSIISKIIKYYCLSKPFPESARLITQSEAANRFAGAEKNSLVSVLLGTLYEVSINHQFNKSDFTPKPSVDTVLFTLVRKNVPRVVTDRWDEYKDFVMHGFNEPIKSIEKKYKNILSQKHLTDFYKKTGINSSKTNPLELSSEQWMDLFEISRQPV